MDRPSIRGRGNLFCAFWILVGYRVKNRRRSWEMKKGHPSSRGAPSRQHQACAPQHNVLPLQHRQAMNKREGTVSFAVSSNTHYSFIDGNRGSRAHEALGYDFTQVRRRSTDIVCHHGGPRESYCPPRRGKVGCIIMILHLQSGLVSRKNVDTESKSRRFSL